MPIYSLDGVAPELPADGECFIAETAVLVGKVRIARGASVWFGAVLRGDNEWIEIGAGANVQDGAMIHTDMGYPCVVGQDCTIGHHAILHGCVVGSTSLVGMGATLLNGVVIGRECLVGANALVTENKSFPDRSLIVGAPARAIRTLDDAAAARLRLSAAGYQANASRFAKGLVRIG